MLAGHLAKEHKQEFAELATAGQQVIGWFFVQRFRHNDADLEQFSEMTRREIRKVTKRVSITDEMIEKQVAAHVIPPGPKIYNDVVTLIKTMRDALDEVQPLA